MLLYFFPSYSIYHFLQKTEFPPECQIVRRIIKSTKIQRMRSWNKFRDTIGDAIAGEEQEEEEEDPEGGA